MKTKPTLALLGLIALVAMVANGQPRPITGGPSNNSGGSSLAATEWKGIYGSGTRSNIPATLRIFSQNGSLMGTLTYDSYEETVSITTGPQALRIKGVSFRDLRGGRTFDLDTFTAQITPDGRRMNAKGGDAKSVVSNEWLQLQKVDSTPGAAPQPASPSFARSLVGSNWDGAIAEGQKGGTPAQLRIVQQNGAPTAILTYEGFEEVLALTFTAPSGIQMRGTSFNDLSHQRRSFTLDNVQGEVSSDGHRMQGQVNRRQFDFRRLN